MNFWKWLLPGLHVKRWLFLAFTGVVLGGFGISVLTGGTLLSFLEARLNKLLFDWFGYLTIPLGILMVLCGTVFFVSGFGNCMRSILKQLIPDRKKQVLQSIYQKRHLEKGPRIVAVGGGTGLSTLLRGLKEYTSNITAIVTVTDDGGSSGRLKTDFGMLPPGDIRNCLVALADTEGSMRELFDYRFDKGNGLAGHSLGNILLAAMSDMQGDFYRAVQETGKVLAIRGRVIPSTLANVTLKAWTDRGRLVSGETSIAESEEKIDRVFLSRKRCRPLPEATEAILEADAVILGPGSLYTSVIPNLLVGGIGEAVQKTQAPVFYVCNVMTQPGETDGYDAADHLEALEYHGGKGIADYILVNSEEIPGFMLRKYREENAFPVAVNLGKLREMEVGVIEEALIDTGDYVRHDSQKLAKALLNKIEGNGGKLEGILASSRTKGEGNTQAR